MEKRFCRKHKKEILNETDNKGKYHCEKCGPISKSKTACQKETETAPLVKWYEIESKIEYYKLKLKIINYQKKLYSAALKKAEAKK